MRPAQPAPAQAWASAVTVLASWLLGFLASWHLGIGASRLAVPRAHVASRARPSGRPGKHSPGHLLSRLLSRLRSHRLSHRLHHFPFHPPALTASRRPHRHLLPLAKAAPIRPAALASQGLDARQCAQFARLALKQPTIQPPPSRSLPRAVMPPAAGPAFMRSQPRAHGIRRWYASGKRLTCTPLAFSMP